MAHGQAEALGSESAYVRGCGCFLLRCHGPAQASCPPGWGIDIYQNCSVRATHTAYCGTSLRVRHRDAHSSGVVGQMSIDTPACCPLHSAVFLLSSSAPQHLHAIFLAVSLVRLMSRLSSYVQADRQLLPRVHCEDLRLGPQRTVLVRLPPSWHP